MPVNISTKQILTFEASDGSKWSYRPLKSFERTAWASMPRETGIQIANVWRAPIDFAVVEWEKVKNLQGEPVEFKDAAQKSKQLEDVDNLILLEVSYQILRDSNLLPGDKKKSLSEPSDSATDSNKVVTDADAAAEKPQS